MEARELRIGNLLDYYGQTVIVLDIKRNQNIECGYFNDSIGFERKLTEKHSPKPIPLTEEWLLKFGFEKIIGSNESNFTDGVYNLFINSLGEVNFYFFKEGDWYQKIDYVHQLQNLHFALTGKELDIC